MAVSAAPHHRTLYSGQAGANVLISAAFPLRALTPKSTGRPCAPYGARYVVLHVAPQLIASLQAISQYSPRLGTPWRPTRFPSVMWGRTRTSVRRVDWESTGEQAWNHVGSNPVCLLIVPTVLSVSVADETMASEKAPTALRHSTIALDDTPLDGLNDYGRKRNQRTGQYSIQQRLLSSIDGKKQG